MDVQQLEECCGDFPSSKDPNPNEYLLKSSDTVLTSEEEMHRSQVSPNSSSDRLQRNGNGSGDQDDPTLIKYNIGSKKQPRYKRYMKHDKKQRLFSCNYCDERFTVRANMKRHMSVHTGKKDFKCQFCDYKCARNDALTSHLRVHFGSSRYACGNCGGKFRTSAILMNHKQVCKRRSVSDFNSVTGRGASALGERMISNARTFPFSFPNNHNDQVSVSNPDKMAFSNSLFAKRTAVGVYNRSASKKLRSMDHHAAEGRNIQKDPSLAVVNDNKRTHTQQGPLDLTVSKQVSPDVQVAPSNHRISSTRENQQLPERNGQHRNDGQHFVVHQNKGQEQYPQAGSRQEYIDNFKSYKGFSTTSENNARSKDLESYYKGQSAAALFHFKNQHTEVYNQPTSSSNFTNKFVMPRKYGGFKSAAQRQHVGVSPKTIFSNSHHLAERSLVPASASGMMNIPPARTHYNENAASLVPAMNYAYKQANMHHLMYLQSSHRLYQLAALAVSRFSTQPALIRGNSIEDREDSENE